MEERLEHSIRTGSSQVFDFVKLSNAIIEVWSGLGKVLISSVMEFFLNYT